ncbi:transglycosylase domain-containing protein, partial [Allorhizocola rhizosphaerae]|uniref:transglycosylase domain-containing protein n=1 Tax=Allorhizocola rhizosphaerae TaxID=1872709 RepID=UPI0013C2C649
MAVFALLLGFGFIGGSYFYDTVPRPSELTLINSTEVFARDDQTQLAKLGTQNRTEVAMGRLDKKVRDALIAGEDKHFYEHHGIDLWGIARAAWNNLTGGSLQGASTITQQYARQAANDLEISYGRKVREAIMARKLEDTYSKEEILGFYLNTVYFGRGAYGIAAAAEAYFGIPADRIGELKVEQAAVLGAVLKQPEPEGGSAKGYDPHHDLDAAKARWHYVLGNMIENGWLSTAERAGMSYPEVRKYDPAKSPGSFGYTNSGTGYVINYVARELAERGVVAYLNENKLGNWKNAGLRITTSIDPRVQRALESELDRTEPNSTMSKQRDNIIGAGVVIDPATGRVLAYYGGTNNGTETDWAGTDQPHPAASTFKIYTLAAAVNAGYKVKSYWSSRELKQATDGYDLTNASRESDPTCDEFCTLEEMTIRSFNVPFFDVSRKITPQKVIEMAHKAGIKSLYTTELKRYDLAQGIPGREAFDHHVAIGQYPITVLDHASGTATLANHGIYHAPHFVLKVERKNRKTGRWEHLSIGDERVHGVKAIDSVVVDEVTSVLKQIPGDAAVAGDGRESAGKTGTWENPNKKGTTAHTWFTGYTEQLVTTIWVGSKDVNATPLTTVQGGAMGSLFPRAMWKRVMDRAHQELALPATKLAGTADYGRIDVGTGKSPSPSPLPSTPPATLTPS